MAEGGYDPMDPTNDKTPLIPGDNDDDDDDTGPWKDIDLTKYDPDGNPIDPDRTWPFTPGAASTPAGEQMPMSTRTRLPTERGPRFQETSFTTGEPTALLAWHEIKQEFEMADENRLKARYKVAPRAGGGGGGAILEIAMKGKDKWYRLYTQSRGDVDKSFNTSLPKEIQMR